MIATAVSPAIGGAMATATSRHNEKRRMAASLYSRVLDVASQGVAWNDRIEVRTINREGVTIAIHLAREGANTAAYMTVHGGCRPFGWKSSPFVICQFSSESDFVCWLQEVTRQAKSEVGQRKAA